MTEVPKIVFDRLRAPELSLQAHPDADLLAGFAEQAISGTERENLLEHLSLCAECREVVALALPASDLVAPPTVAAPNFAAPTGPVSQTADEKRDTAVVRGAAGRAGAFTPRRLSLAWPSLRWAALSAGVAVAAAVLLMHPGKLNQAMLPAAKSPVATPISPSPIPPSANDKVALLAKTNLDEARPQASPPETKTQSKTERKAGNTALNKPQPAPGSENSQPLETSAVRIAVPNNRMKSRASAKASRGLQANAPAIDSLASVAPGVTEMSANEPVEVSAASPAELTPSPQFSQLAQNEAPAIEKAKPVPQEVQTERAPLTAVAGTGSEPTTSQNRNSLASVALPVPALTSWVITSGVLQRSLDNGQTWQNALQADHSLSCYAEKGAEIWAGGRAGALFHSVDGGVTWVRVQPSIKSQSLSSDITRITLRVSDPQTAGLEVSGAQYGDMHKAASASPAKTRQTISHPGIMIVTSNGEIWTSDDGGKTWDKK